ncbi:MAG: hypothetical protein EBT71_08675 [Alphaproteobacteria bacterium]|nr:hypothetical protein [Alphaproteobacteria bacterium]
MRGGVVHQLGCYCVACFVRPAQGCHGFSMFKVERERIALGVCGAQRTAGAISGACGLGDSIAFCGIQQKGWVGRKHAMHEGLRKARGEAFKAIAVLVCQCLPAGLVACHVNWRQQLVDAARPALQGFA